MSNSRSSSFKNIISAELDKSDEAQLDNHNSSEPISHETDKKYDKIQQQKLAHRNCLNANIYLSELWRRTPQNSALLKSLQTASATVCSGLTASARPLFIQACHSGLNLKPIILWITPTSDSAERLFQDCHTFFEEDQLWLFPEKESVKMLGDEADTADPARLAVLQMLDRYQEQDDQKQKLIIAPLRAVMQPTVRAEKLEKSKLTLKVGENIDIELLLEILNSEGYSRVPMVEGRGQYAVRGGLIDVYPITGQPARLELFGEEIETIRAFNIDTQRSSGDLKEVVLLPAVGDSQDESWLTDYLQKKAPHALVVLEEPVQLRLTAKEWNQEWEAQASSGASIGFIEESETNYVWERLENMLDKFRKAYTSAWASDLDVKGQSFNNHNFNIDPSHCFEAGFELAVPFTSKVDDLLTALPTWQKAKRRTVLLTSQYMRLKELLEEHDIAGFTTKPCLLKPGQVLLLQGYANEGFRVQLDDGWLEFLTDREIMGQRLRRRLNKPADKSGSALRLDEIAPGDLVVHLQHGIARYIGIQTISLNNVEHDMLKLEYAKGDCVFVPVDQLDLVQKYEGIDGKEPTLSKMNGTDWRKTKAKIRAYAAEAAQKLLQIYAQRAKAQGFAYPQDTPWQHEMEDAFPYQETPDQLRAIREVKADLESPRPMDRLICGDVGYGKTEVALRAAFKVVNHGKQVAVLVPTTVLAHQHFMTFTERLAPYPIHIGLLSRFKTAAEQKQIAEALAEGKCDIVIGTHRLLSQDIKFKNLGLLIIDEEQRFGVMHKTKLSELKAGIDIMSMSATPIPRTLQMSFYGIREMSVIETPPENRLPIKTYLFEHNAELIKAAIVRELSRHGQVYFLHNRVQSIARVAADLQRLVPQARIAVGHGQMGEQKLEKVMMEFYEGQYDVLVCSTIIESGLDVPNVNTIIIDNAHALGLAQLYQLRGRVGRSAKQGYCYLLYPPSRKLTDQAKKRLETIRDFTQLGAGFQVAKRDLEIRGAGDILGAEQSGHVAAVGFSLYCRMLSDAVKALRNHKDPEQEAANNEQNVVIDLPISTGLPDDYIGDPQQKVVLYKRIASVESNDKLQDIREELRDRYGKLPELTEHLLSLVRIKLKCRSMLIPSIRVKGGVMWFVAPFMRQLTPRELGKLSNLVGWKASQDQMALQLDGICGRAAGNLDYPKPQVLITKIEQVLAYLEALSK
ncbi:MAG: transcription-repair coupling factor [Candidatus Bruticola sp.]